MSLRMTPKRVRGMKAGMPSRPKYYMPSDGASFDPSTQNTTVFQVLKMAYTPLLRYEPSVLTSPTSEIISNLAGSWEFSPDATGAASVASSCCSCSRREWVCASAYASG